MYVIVRTPPRRYLEATARLALEWSRHLVMVMDAPSHTWSVWESGHGYARDRTSSADLNLSDRRFGAERSFISSGRQSYELSGQLYRCRKSTAFWPRQNYAVLMLRLGRFDASAVISINPRQTKLIFMQQI
jgi:hypothetical protein